MKTSKKKLSIIGMLVAIMVSIVGSVAEMKTTGAVENEATNGHIFTSSSIISSPITINSDDEAAAIADSGSGTATDPFVISGKSITIDEDHYMYYVEGGKKRMVHPCVGIKDTTAYISIRDCVLFTNDLVSQPVPLFLYNNLHVSVYGSSLHGGRFPAFIAGNMGTTVPGIVGDYVLSDCTVYPGGTDSYGKMVATEYIQSMTMSGCTVINAWDTFPNYCIGYDIISTKHVVMWDNTFVKCGISSDGLAFETTYDIDTSNIVDGAPVFWIAGKNSFVLDGNVVGDAGQIHVALCADFVVQNFDVCGGSFPVGLTYCTSGVIRNVHASNATWDAISVLTSTSIDVENCIVEWSTRGGILFGGVNWLAPGHSYIRNNVARDCGRPIRILISSGVTIENNVAYVTGNALDMLSADPTAWVPGIEMQTANDVLITGNTIFNTTLGIAIGKFYFEPLGHNVTIDGNVLLAIPPGYPFVYSTGIFAWMGNDLMVENNYIAGYVQGAEVTSNGVVRYNEFYQNSQYGLALDNNDFSVYGNNFVGNGGFQAEDTWYGGANTMSVDGIGNYWSNYEERYPGATNDGFEWNTPYVLQYGSTDDHPLVNKYHPDRVGFLLMRLKASVAILRAMIDECIDGGKENACLVQLEKVAIAIDDMTSIHEAGGAIPKIAIKSVDSKMHSISKVAKVDAITSACAVVSEFVAEIAA